MAALLGAYDGVLRDATPLGSLGRSRSKKNWRARVSDSNGYVSRPDSCLFFFNHGDSHKTYSFGGEFGLGGSAVGGKIRRIGLNSPTYPKLSPNLA